LILPDARFARAALKQLSGEPTHAVGQGTKSCGKKRSFMSLPLSISYTCTEPTIFFEYAYEHAVVHHYYTCRIPFLMLSHQASRLSNSL
jgi:hypothetical protein